MPTQSPEPHDGLHDGPSLPPGYYGVPAIHRPHWKWLIVGYFFFGGISGSSAAISAAARLFGGPRSERLARTATVISIAALLPCPPLLILDLGRPRRFLNMLRAFRPSSPMSMGTWGFTAFSAFLALDAALQLPAPRCKRRSGARHDAETTVAALAGLGGLFLAGYTGVLLSATAVPLWSKRPAILGPLFLSSAMSSGSATVLATYEFFESTDDSGTHALHRLEMVAALTEGVLLVSWLHSLGATARPLEQGLLGYVVRRGVGAAGIAVPLVANAVASLLPPRLRRGVRIGAAALTLAGVFALRYAVIEGGRQSADDPAATFDLTG